MKAFAKVHEHINTLDDSYKAGSVAYKQAIASASEKYKGEMLESKIAELNEALANSRAEQLKKAKDSVAPEFVQMRKTLKEMIASPVPTDFTSTLAAVQAMGKNLSEADAEVLLEKYSGNYLASKCLLDVLHDNDIAMKHTVRNAAEALSSVDSLENQVATWIDKHSGNISEADELANAIFCSESLSPVAALSAKIDAISESGFID